MVLLAKEERVDRRSIHAGTEEPLLTMYLQILCKRSERLLRHAGVVDGELAGNVVKLLDAPELLQVGCRCRVRAVEDSHIPIVGLVERLGHVAHHQEHGRELVATRLLGVLQVAHISTLTARGQIGLRDIKPHHQLGLGPLPLEHVACTTHGQLQQSVARLDARLVQLLLDPIVERVHILQNAVASIQIVAVVQVVLGQVINRLGGEVANHGLRNRHVDVCPDGLSHGNVVAKLRLAQHAVLVGLVVARPQHGPVIGLRVVGALHDGIVLDPIASLVHWRALHQRQRDDVRIGLARNRGLERRRCTVTRLGNPLQISGHGGRRVLTRQRLAGIQNVGAAVAGDIQTALEHMRLERGVVALTCLEPKQEVNAVLVRRLPLVHAEPGVAAAVLHGSHGTCLRSED